MDNQERLKHAFTVLLDVSFGTLWWVDNELWKQEKMFVLKSEQEGGFHPGISIQHDTPQDPYVVPLLLGRSEKQSCREACLEVTQDRPTYFGSLKPVRMSFMNFLDGSIHVNHGKPRVAASEKEELIKFISGRLSW